VDLSGGCQTCFLWAEYQPALVVPTENLTLNRQNLSNPTGYNPSHLPEHNMTTATPRYETRYVIAPKGQPWTDCKRYESKAEARNHLRPGLVMIECQVCYEIGHPARIIGAGDIIEEA
jgi:hypothetical protein